MLSFDENAVFRNAVFQQRKLLKKHIADEAHELQVRCQNGEPINPIRQYSPEESALLELCNRLQENHSEVPCEHNYDSDDRMAPSFIQELSPSVSDASEFGNAGFTPPTAMPLPGLIDTPSWAISQLIPDIKRSAKATRVRQPFLKLAIALTQAVPLRSYASSIYHFDGTIYRPLNEQELKTLILQVLKPQMYELGTPQAMRSIAEFLLAMQELQAVPNTDGRWLCLRNGVLDLETGRQFPLSPKHFFTSFIDVGYCSQAGGNSCPMFLHFLNTAMDNNSIYVQRILEIIGYILVPDMRGKVFFHLVGVGDSGKSVLGNLISSFFNPEAISNLDIFRFGDRFSLSSLVGKRLNISMDLPNGRLPAPAVAAIKQLTGGDAISIEEKYKPVFSYRSDCKLLFGSNQDLVLIEDDPAFFNREVNVVFRHGIPKGEQDQHLLDHLKQEKSGIFNLAISAYNRLRQHNYRFSGENQTLSLFVSSQTQGLSYETGIIGFLQDCCQFDEQAFSTMENLHESYRKFCLRSSVPFLSDRAAFSARICNHCGPSAKRLQKRVGGQPKRGFQGIRLRNMEEQ